MTPPPVVASAPPVVVTPPASSPSSSAMSFGVGGHSGYTAYPLSQTEAVFSLLNSKNIRKYRIDVNAANFAVLDTMVPLAKKYGITLRPMIYPTTQAQAYTFAKRYANDIKIWEIGNEQDQTRTGAQDRINVMVSTYKGIKQASDELGAKLETTINIMGCNSDYTGPGATCAGEKAGAMWFTEMARNSGFLFDHVSFHYYPHYGDKGYFMDLILSQLRGFAVKYNTKIYYNEVNCAEIYDGNTTGGFAGDKGCYDSIKQIFDILKTSYSDVIAEVTMYELFDNTDIGGTEGHFGLLYDINKPKPNFNLLVDYANKP
ncbi:hypothetical protein CIK05_05100 [Bdellovibrio sp. qaytius]|nr:hypothetical protein CIK05_05100 [Bdellovibrio sp. qaytius]